MQRPMMNPTWYEPAPGPPPRRRRLHRVGAGLAAAWRVAWSNPFVSRRRAELNRVEQSLASRFVRGLAYRLLFIPPLLTLIAWVLVFTATHPPQRAVNQEPTSQGVYYDPVTFTTDDAQRLEGWLVPQLDARQIIEEKEKALRRRHPAVVLVHDRSQSRQELLPLVRPLHDSGMVVLLVGLRGGGIGGTPHTYGLKESLDVKAAVELLRRRPFVDPRRIGLVGVGTGANAAILAADRDAALGVLVLQDPVRQFDDVVSQRMVPDVQGLRWMQVLCKWTFQITCGVDADDLNFARYERMLEQRTVLMMERPEEPSDTMRSAEIRQIQDFLVEHLNPELHQRLATGE